MDAAQHPALRQAALPDLVPAHRFAYRGQDSSDHQLSPDGQKLAWVGPSWGRSALFVRDLRSGREQHWRAPGSVRWTADSRHLLYASDTSGREQRHVFVIDTEAEGAQPRDLTPHRGVQARIQQLSESEPTQVLVTHNRRDPRLFDLYRIDLVTGAETLVARNPGNAVAPLLQDDGAMLGWQPSREALRPQGLRRMPQAVRQPALRQAETGSVRVLRPTRDPQVAWALSSRGRDRAALVLLHTRLGWEKLVFEDPVADVTGAHISRVTGQPLLATANPGYPRVEILDARLREDLAPLLVELAGAPHGLAIRSTDRDEQRLILAVYTATWSRTYLLDRSARRLQLLASTLPRDMSDALVAMQPVQLATRDGQALHGFLHLPRGPAPRGLPMVLLVHGGPWAQVSWSDPLGSDDNLRAQFLANRGYAVLQVNFRGSTGYGRRWRQAAIGEFAGRMQDDLLDATQWAIDRGIADPQRIAIAGLSYGGYASLVGLSASPKTFACGISIGGPTDLATLIESFPAYWKVDLSTWHDYVGNPAVPEDRVAMTARSPLTHAARIDRPVLLIHGERDVRVRLDQSRRMAQALRDAGRPVRLVTIAEMGHAPSYWAHQQQSLREMERFLHGCLGGRATRVEPFDWLAWAWTRLS